jgi:hypothetical protein
MLVTAGISNASGGNAKSPCIVPKAHSSDAPPQDPPTKSATSEREEICCCRGITLQTIHASRTTNKEIVYRGFRHLIGEAMREMANAISNNTEWREDSSVRGKLQAPHNGMPWKLRQFADFTERGDPAKQFGFHAQSKGKASCTGKRHIASGNTLCGTCHSNQHLFVKRCLNACIRREKEFEKEGGRNDLLHASPTLQDKKIVYLAKENKELQRIANQAKKKLDQMNSKKKGGI